VVVLGVALMACAIIPFLHQTGLSPGERRLLGRWTYRTIDETHQLVMLDLREDRIAVLAAPEHIPALTDFYDWRIVGDTLVLTHYVYRQPGETAFQKARRGALSIRERLRGGRAEQEPVEALRILRIDSDSLELQLQPLGADPSPESIIRLARAADSEAKPQEGGIR